LRNLGDLLLGMLAQRFAGVDLMIRDPYVHVPGSFDVARA
jgi:hypothetical protein